jgi:hypothetical protein
MKAKFRYLRAAYYLHLLQYRLEMSKLLLQRSQHLSCSWFACVKITMSGTSHRLKYCTDFVVYRFIICKCTRGLHNTPRTDTRDPRTGGLEPQQYGQYSILQMVYQHKRLQTILMKFHYDTSCTLCSALKNA